MTAPIYGGFTWPNLLDLLERACASVGLDAAGAVLLRGQTNAVFRLELHPVVVKISRNGTDLISVDRTVKFVRWLMDLEFPTVSLYRPECQPLVIDGHAVSLWTYLSQPPYPVAAESIAMPLRRLHSLTGPPISLRSNDPCAAIRSSLSRIEILSEEVISLLAKKVDELDSALAGIHYELPPAILQGDPQHRNALYEGDRAVLCDWDSAVFGQPEWDLVTMEIHCRRFGYGLQHYARFSEVYGWDVTSWSGFPVLRDLRELRMITTNARKASHEPEKVAEVVRRIDQLRDRNVEGQWNIL